MTAGSSNTAGGTGARSRALTLVEVIVVVLILLALMSLIPLVNAFAQPRTTSMCCYCGTNLKASAPR